jgi:hypothetical protein
LQIDTQSQKRDNINGTKIASLGIECLQNFIAQASALTLDGSPLIICGDFNATNSA